MHHAFFIRQQVSTYIVSLLSWTTDAMDRQETVGELLSFAAAKLCVKLDLCLQ